MSRFFEIFFDADGCPDMWQLKCPIDDCGNQLETNLLPRVGPYVGPKISKVQIDTRYPGQPLDFSFGYFNFLMVTSKVADLIDRHGGQIQRFPVILEPTQESGYEVIFTLDAPRGLIDLSRAEEVEYYEESDTKIDQRYGGVAPRQKGMLRRLYPVLVDAKKAEGMSFFRPWEYGRLIVSAELKNAFEAAGVTGIAYQCCIANDDKSE
jgi:hypothetical protein